MKRRSRASGWLGIGLALAWGVVVGCMSEVAVPTGTTAPAAAPGSDSATGTTGGEGTTGASTEPTTSSSTGEAAGGAEPMSSGATEPTAGSTTAATESAATESATTEAPAADGGVAIDATIPAYQAAQGVSGTVKSKGSDTMNKLMQHWTEGFRGLYPNVVAEVEGTGSATAMPALVAGTANFGPMSRDPKEKEISDFEAAFGYPPTLAPTAVDILAVYVHRDNPIQGLTFQQLDAIFSSTRKGGAEKQVRTWGDLGLTGEWADKPISCYGRTAASGTYGYFKERALFGGDFHDGVKEQPGNASIIQGVGGDRYGIGYSAMGYRTPDVKAVPLALEVGGEFVPPEPARALAGDYPLARYLWMAVNYKPGTELDPLRREFLMYVFSREGQQVVVKDGYLPLPAPIVEESLAKFGLKR